MVNMNKITDEMLEQLDQLEDYNRFILSGLESKIDSKTLTEVEDNNYYDLLKDIGKTREKIINNW